MVGLEKDKFYLYKSEWNEDAEVLHVFPHWSLPEMQVKKSLWFAIPLMTKPNCL